MAPSRIAALVEKLEAEIATWPNNETLSYEDGLRKAIAIVRQHLAEQAELTEEDAVEVMTEAYCNHGEKGKPYGNPFTDGIVREKMQAAYRALRSIASISKREPGKES